MPRQTRHSTEFSGVYFVKLANENQSFFIRYKRNGKSVEEKAGRSNEGWDAEIACLLRAERMSANDAQAGELQQDSASNAGQLWTFSKIFEKYLRLRPDLKGRENDIYRFKNYLELDFADIAPEEVTHDDVERFRHNLQNKSLKPATVRHVLELLRRLANFAVKKNYCRGLSFKLEMPKVENQKTEELTQFQLQNLLRVLEEDPDLQVSNLVRMALYTGMRRGELFELCWSDIDFHHKTITVRSAKSGQHPTIPLNEMAERVLAEHAHVEGSSKFVFPGRAGKKRTECKRPLLRIRKNAGLPEDFRLLQGLRHVYATKLVSSGKVDLETLQSLLTQKSPLMTQRYAYLLDQRVEVPEMEIATDSTDETDLLESEIATDSTDSEKARDYTESKIATDNTDYEIATDSTDYEIATEDAVTEIAMDSTDYEIATDNTDLDSNVETPESVEATDSTDYEIATDYTETVAATDYAETVIATDYTEIELATDSTDSEETPEVVLATDFTDKEIATDVDEIEEVPETVLESKTPELSQLVKQNYSVIKPTENRQSEVYSPKNIVVEKKVAEHVEEKRIQQKARPTLKDLKNDLKSLSQLIQTAPRKSKISTPKLN